MTDNIDSRPSGRLYRVVAPHFVAGVVVEGDHVVRAAPILAWTVGRRRDSLRPYFARKGWSADYVRQP